MAKLFCGDRIVPVWVDAVRELSTESNRTARNYVLEIARPAELISQDVAVISEVNKRLLQGDSSASIYTVAGTIFPNRLYRHYGRPDFYDHFLRVMKNGKDYGTWGTYALRMIRRSTRDGKETFNPLEKIVEKLIKSKNGRRITAAYELGVFSPTDLADAPNPADGVELPIYDPITDGGRPTNIPCLSHLSFKLQEDDTIDLTAVYRSHYYAQRTLGNLIGLSQLQAFVAKEAGFKQGWLTCVSTQAHLDTGAWGGVAATTELLKSFPPAEI